MICDPTGEVSLDGGPAMTGAENNLTFAAHDNPYGDNKQGVLVVSQITRYFLAWTHRSRPAQLGARGSAVSARLHEGLGASGLV